ncbi:rab-GTPase-TBC domain-containing protein, partial [Ochromonadaceae sp. CCMP2298]
MVPLATHLQEQDSPPELYSPHWFLTLYAHALPLPQVLRLWDMLIAVDDPSFTFFIGLCLLLRRRDQLLLADRERIPEILMRVQFQGEYSVARSTVSLAQDIQHDTQGEGEIDEVLTQAREAYDSTPRCFLRYLRLCAVSTTELMPQPKGGGVGGAGGGDGAKGPHPASPAPRLIEHDSDCSLAIQSARGCLALSPQELVPTLAPSLAPSLPSPPSLPNG